MTPPSRGTVSPRSAAYAMVAAFSLGMLWFTSQGFMRLDDYQIQSRAYAAPWLAPDFLFQPWAGHVMPASFALAQVLAKLTPFTYVPMILLMTAGMTAFAIALARLSLDVLGNRWLALLPLAVGLVSGATWDSATWWAAALNGIPLLIVIPLATLLHLRWLRGDSFGAGLLAWVTVSVGCLFFEKTVAVAAFLGVISIALRGRWPSARRRTARNVTLLALYAVTAIVFVAIYLASRTASVASVPDTATALAFLDLGALRTFPPLAVGGPWWWTSTGSAGAPLAVSVVAAAAVLALAVYQIVRASPTGAAWPRRVVNRATLLWGFCFVYVVAAVLIITAGRAAWGPQVITQPRYFADAVLFVIISATLCHAYLAQPSTAARRLKALSAVVICEALIASAACTFASLSGVLQDNPSRVYTVGALSSLEESVEPVLNGLVPNFVMWPLVSPENQLRNVFAPSFPEDRFPDSADSLRVLAWSGRVEPGEVDGVEPNLDATPPCAWPLTEAINTAVLDIDLPEYWHTVALDYLAGATTDILVQVGSGTPVPFRLKRGLHTAYVFAPGGGDEIRVSRTLDGVGVCITSVTVGATKPREP